MKTNIVQKETGNAGHAQPVAESWCNPEVDIFETPEAYVILAEMPGVSKAGLEVSVEGNELTLIGRRGQAETPGEWLHREGRGAHFRRAFELDPAIDPGKIVARMDQGVLTLELPKAERVKPRKISVGD